LYEITIEELNSLDLDKTLLVDLRTTKEYQQGTIQGAISMPLDDVGKSIGTLPHDKLICVFCATGDWSYQVVELLRDLDYEAVHLIGGYSAYVNRTISEPIYLDYSANTPIDTAVLDDYYHTAKEYSGNPNSNHVMGINAHNRLTQATEHIAKLLNVEPSEIVYTSGATESNNTAIKGIARISRHKGKHIISTSLEHSSVSGTLTNLQEQGYEIDLVNITSNGTIDLNHLKTLLREDTILVAICAVDSELGVVQPIQGVVDILKDYPNCKLHVDCTQAIGKVEFSFRGIDTASFTAHKFYGLNSCGILYKGKNAILEPLLHGGKSTTIYRSGTPDLAMAVAMEKALDLAITNLYERSQRVQTINQTLTHQLKQYPLVRINSTEMSVPHILNLSVKGVKSKDFQQALNSKGVCVSTKSACSTPNTPSRAVYEVSKDRKNALSSWRISISHLTTDDEVSRFLKAFDTCYKDLTK
jgi:cysteine desulfurase